MFSLGRMAVTPVRTGPFPRRSGPAPRMMVECPTRTPATSVMEFQRPGRKRPSGTPSSRARYLASVLGVTGEWNIRREGPPPSPEPEGGRKSSTLRMEKRAPPATGGGRRPEHTEAPREDLQPQSGRSDPELRLLLLLLGRG